MIPNCGCIISLLKHIFLTIWLHSHFTLVRSHCSNKFDWSPGSNTLIAKLLIIFYFILQIYNSYHASEISYYTVRVLYILDKMISKNFPLIFQFGTIITLKRIESISISLQDIKFWPFYYNNRKKKIFIPCDSIFYWCCEIKWNKINPHFLRF